MTPTAPSDGTNGQNGNVVPSPTPTSPTRVIVMIPTTTEPRRGLQRWLYGPNGQAKLAPVVQTTTVTHVQAGYVEDVRQYMVDAFLALDPPVSWLLMVDDDTVPKLSALALVEGAEAAGVLMTASPVPFHPFIIDGTSPRGIHANLFRVDSEGMGHPFRWHDVPWPSKGGSRFWASSAAGFSSAGFGCTLLHRSVLARMVEQAKRGKMEWPMRAIWKNGRVLRSEDIAFWLRAARLGYRLYADLGNPCSHDKRWLMSPESAVDDLAFDEPGASPHPEAPSLAPPPAEGSRAFGPRLAASKLACEATIERISSPQEMSGRNA